MWGQIILFYRGAVLHYRIFSSVPGLYLLTLPTLWQPKKCLQTLLNQPCLRTTWHSFWHIKWSKNVALKKWLLGRQRWWPGDESRTVTVRQCGGWDDQLSWLPASEGHGGGSNRGDHSFNSTWLLPPKEIRQGSMQVWGTSATRRRIFERH